MDADLRISPVPTVVLLSRVWRAILFAGLLAVVLTGCATPPPANDPDAVAEFKQTNDPLEPTNRVFYAVNNGIDTVLIKPAAQAYRFVVPGGIRTGIHNVLSNLGTSVQLTNDIMQGKPRRAGDTTMRFLINSTVGLVGVFDVATGWGYPNHDTDFGLTLANWGVSDGPFLFLPVLGPSGPRDFVGFGVDTLQDPFTWVGHTTALKAVNWTRFGLNVLDSREQYLDAVDQIKKTALDPYATFRSLYRQHREGEIVQLREDNRATIPVWFPQAQTNTMPPQAR
jgi:phospholipid-binding lipoprotein MlaA